MPLGNALCHVGLGSRIGPEPSDGDDMQRAVRRSVTASIEAMAGRLAGRSRNWAHTTKSREAGLGMYTLRVVPSRQEQLCGGPVADRVPRDESGGELVDNSDDHGVEVCDLVM